MTPDQALKIIQAATPLRYGVRKFYRDVKRLKISPLGVIRSRPQQYPDDIAEAIIAARGFESALTPLPPADTAFAALSRVKLPSMSELKREKRKALSRRSTQTKKGSR